MTEIITELRNLGTALEQERFQEASDSSKRVIELYSENHVEERLKLERAKTGIEDIPNNNEEPYTVLSEFIVESSSLELSRAGLLTALSIAVTDWDGIDTDEIQDGINQLVEREHQVSDIAWEAQLYIDDLEVTGEIELLRVENPSKPIPKGERFESSLLLGNIGDDAREAVISLESDELLIFDEQKTVELMGNTVNAFSFEMQGKNHGQSKFGLTIDQDGVQGIESSSSIDVLNKQSYIQRVRKMIDELSGKLERSGSGQSFVSKLENTDKQLRRALNHVQSGRVGKADRTIRTAMNILNALVNEAEGKNKSKQRGNGARFNDAFMASVIESSNKIIAELDEAIKAEA